jgi:hypothetical protein
LQHDYSVKFRSGSADRYVVDTSSLDRDEQIAACRSALELVGADAGQFQCDVPWGQRAKWPDEVGDAAVHLVPVRSGYQTSGWISDFNLETWQAFVMFAPYAYSADVWTTTGAFLAEVNDEGTSVTVRVLPEQLKAFEQSAHGANIVALNDWQARK